MQATRYLSAAQTLVIPLVKVRREPLLQYLQDDLRKLISTCGRSAYINNEDADWSRNKCEVHSKEGRFDGERL